jgi:uncharacterized GH25 family protein
LGNGIQDPGSGKNLFRIPDPGVKKAPDPGSGSATLQKNPENGILSGFKIFGTENILTLSQGSSDASKLTSSSR